MAMHFEIHVDDVARGMLRRLAGTPATGGPIRGAPLTFPVRDMDGRHDWALAHGGAEALPPVNCPGMSRVAHIEDGGANVIGLNDRDAEDTRA